MGGFRPLGGTRENGFIIRELAAVVSILIAFAALFTVWSSTLARKTDVVRCLANGRQMMQAFSLYAQDHGGLLAPNEDEIMIGHSWFASYSGGPAETTNQFLAGDSQINRLAPYATHFKIWKCPADPNVILLRGQRIPTVRSVSMSQAVGTVCTTWPNGHSGAPLLRPHGYWLTGSASHRRDSVFRTFGRENEFVRPATTFVFIDEHPPSLNDASFGTPGYNPKNPGMSTIRWVDYPATYHGNAGSLTYGDGHAELRRWRRLKYPATGIPGLAVTTVLREDWEWLAMHTTQPLR